MTLPDLDFDELDVEPGWMEVPPISLSPQFLEIAACPACRSGLAIDYEAGTLVCLNQDCALIYPVRDGIPILLVDEARKAEELEPGND